jgi:hypothetical protein
MKKLFILKLIVFLSTFHLSFSQNITEQSNFFVENGELQYRKVFEIEGITEEDLISKLNTYLPSVSGLNDITFNGGAFTGNLNGFIVDFKKYGARLKDVFLQLQHPINSKISIQVKDNRYRVILSDIKGLAPYPIGEFEYFYTLTDRKLNNESFHQREIAINGMNYMDQAFTEKFTLKESQVNDDW